MEKKRLYKEVEMLRRYNAIVGKENHAFFSESYSLEKFAQDMCTNRTYASRFLNEVIGCSFIELCHRFRLQKALALKRKNPRMSPGELAHACGFHSTQQLRTLFLQHYGYSL